ncbi:MAG TPA: sensor domain-containing protein [Gaiellaceae bacterium]|jgi:signal transduction histidine kinase|nr:sensor domain-containing protein [Gaiellaceae bacterium]
MHRLLQPLREAATYRSLLFLGSAWVTGSFALAVLIAGWSLTASVLITPLVIPVVLGFRAAVGALAGAEASLARELLGVEIRAGRTSSGGTGFWARGEAVLKDRAFWREQAYLGLRIVLGWPFAAVVIGLVFNSLFVIAMPLYYRWTNTDLGIGRIDTLQKAVLVMPLGVVGLVLAGQIARPLTFLWIWIAGNLLRGDEALRTSAAEARVLRRKSLLAHALASAVVSAVIVVVWALTGASDFWPQWPLLALALPLAIHAWFGVVMSRTGDRRGGAAQAFAIHAGVLTSLEVFFLFVWAMTGHDSFWPIWPMLAFGILLTAHGLVVFLHRKTRGELEERIDVLETTRAGAVDVQESELRRIERDLHDGAQARLVALGMNLGMAEQKLVSDLGGARELVTEARLGVEEALRELRDLARGIHPPVLTDRGLEAAIAALTDRSPIPVNVTANVAARPPAAVETAAYFVAAEGLTNAAKHAGATRIDVHIVREATTLVLEIADDGRGGAKPDGDGLRGLRRRVEALDGMLTIDSPSGGGTRLRAELPCAS